MKKTFFMFLILTVNIYTQWITVNAINSAKHFRDISVVNSDIMWALLDDTVNNIYRSTNGGINWQLVGSQKVFSGFISAVSENHAWVSGINSSYRIYNTVNGGVSWSEQVFLPNNYINFIKFFNSNTGFFISDPTNDTTGFFITRNGGVNWIRSPYSPLLYSSAFIENCANALDTNFIWLCAKINNSTYKFYKLTGGLNNQWQSYDYGISGYFRKAAFKNALTGLVTDGSKLLITTNGGINWSIRNNQSFGGGARDIIHVPGTDWVIQNTTNKICVSYDFCLNWNDTLTYSQSIYGDAKSYNSAWLSGDSGKVLHLDYTQIGINQISSEIPADFKLYQNFPNPFNPETNIRFALPAQSDFRIQVFDILGREVYSVEDSKPAGEYVFKLDGSSLSSGIYFYRLDAGKFSDTKKLMIIK
jgi:hypothetical protein